ncbi:MAG TPA: thioredoxin domain-containing protein [Candidatus Babeliales bacterium]|nr:thioredoxin domain-containing protein [Candidatus Babeliales bacterium]
MKLYNKKMIICLAMFIVFMPVMFYAKVRTIGSSREFEQSIAKKSMVVVLFYVNKDRKLIHMYDDVSTYQPYNDADIVFLKVNTARKELNRIALSYGINVMPTFMFFNNGKPLLDNEGAVVSLTNFVTRDVLQSFINQHYGVEIENYIKQKKNIENQRLAQEGEAWKSYFYPRDMVVSGYDPAERSME